MDKAKETIKTLYKGDSFEHLTLWVSIDSERHRQLHSLLHAVGVYLNPSIFYNEGSKIQKDLEVMRGLMIFFERMYLDQDMQDKMNMQRDLYKESFGMFGFN